MTLQQTPESFWANMLDENRLFGCEGGDPGSYENPSIWVFGIEPGYSGEDDKLDESSCCQDEATKKDAYGMPSYPVDIQVKWRFNQGVFKLLAAINAFPVTEYTDFAKDLHIFESRGKGYLRGNLSPIPFSRAHMWDDYARVETGCNDRMTYEQRLKDIRPKTIQGWIKRYRPKLLIGIGTSRLQLFRESVRATELKVEKIAVKGRNKYIRWYIDGLTKLVVLPHVSGSSNGLNSNEAIQEVGAFIKNKIINYGDI